MIELYESLSIDQNIPYSFGLFLKSHYTFIVLLPISCFLFFYELKVCDNSALSNSFGTIFFFQQHLLILCLCVTFW